MQLEDVEPQEVNVNIKYVTTPGWARTPDDGKNKEYVVDLFTDISNKTTIRVMPDVPLNL